MPELDDLRGVSLATLHALTNAALIVGVPVLIGRRITAGRRFLITPAAVLCAAGLTFFTRASTWALVRIWLDLDRESGQR